MAEKKNILIIRYSPVKLFFQSIPTFKAIREHHKNDNLVLLTDETHFEFAKNLGIFDRVWLDIKPHWLEVPSIIDIIKRLKKGNFSRVYDLSFTQHANWYFRLLGVKKPEWNGNISWCKFPYRPDALVQQHYQDYIRNQVAVAGVNEVGFFDLKSIQTDISKFNLPKNYVMICPAGDKEKLAHKWSIYNYADIIQKLESLGISSVLVGGNDDDYWLNNNIIKQAIGANPINLAGQTTLADLVSIANNALFTIGNDTAPTHISSLCGAKTIMLLSRFSPAEMIVPRVTNLAVIEEPYLENLSVERVYNAIKDFCELDRIVAVINSSPEKTITLTKDTPYKAY